MTVTSIGRMERGDQVIEKRTELAVLWLKNQKKAAGSKRKRVKT